MYIWLVYVHLACVCTSGLCVYIWIVYLSECLVLYMCSCIGVDAVLLLISLGVLSFGGIHLDGDVYIFAVFIYLYCMHVLSFTFLVVLQ